MQAALLRHPAIGQDQQVVVALLRATKQLQAAVAEQCAGLVPATLHVQQPQQALCFVRHRHGGLLRELEVQVGASCSCCSSRERRYIARWHKQVVEALATGLEQQQQQQYLQAFSLHGVSAGPILHHLPTTCLTRLCVSLSLGFRKWQWALLHWPA